MTSSCKLCRFPLHDRHAALKAKFGAFGEWEVPLYYSSILLEHEAVRSAAGVFDISHMGEFFIEGPEAASFLESVLPRSIAGLKEGKALYMPLLHSHGGIVDDVILYRFGKDRFAFIVNAANVAKDAQWFEEHIPAKGVQFEDKSDQYGLLALQGPASPAILAACLGEEYLDLPYYGFKALEQGMIARTGYTGEDGFEIMLPRTGLEQVWDKLFKEGKRFGLVPVGFGARDTLRLEAAMLLYGHDMSDDVTPLEAGIHWAVDFNKKTFEGRDSLIRQREEGVGRKIVGFEMIERGIPRQDQAILKDGKEVGRVTSGSFAPTLKKNIGLGLMNSSKAELDDEIEILIRDKSVKARIVKTPFYKRKK